MKKVILSALAVCAFGFVNAQEGNGIQFGVKAGLNMSKISGAKGADGKDLDGKTGFYFGGVATKAINEKFAVQAELLYSMEGADKAKLDYLRIPVMAKYSVMDKLAVMAGPSIAFKMGDEESTKNTKSMDFGLGFGLSYDITSNIFVDARYNVGLSDIKDSGAGDSLKNNNFQVGVGYKF